VIEILEAGPLTSIQGAVGRRGWRHLGVPVGGAADAWSARLANRLVGNPDDAAVLEITLGGLVLTVDRPTRLALTGGLASMTVPANEARGIRAGALVRIDLGDGARGYLAVGGGIVVESVLGSTSTDLRTGFGGFEGRALRTGDRLPVGAASARTALRWTGVEPAGPIRIVAGPHAHQLSSDGLRTHPWRISSRSDRTGARLEGPALPPADEGIESIGLPAGAIQLPPDGQPIIALADRPVTGGYPVPAVVIGADLGRVARLRPGDELRLATVSMEEARGALRAAEKELAALEPLDAVDDDELRWVGSHE